MICALLLAIYVSACHALPPEDWALVESVAYDPYNRGSSTDSGITLPIDPHTTGPLWILAHEVAHVKQRKQPAFWADAFGHPPCTAYVASFTDPILYAAENQAERYASELTGLPCSMLR